MPAGAIALREGSPVDSLGVVVDGRLAIRLAVPGRGAWVHPRSVCIEAALARGGLARALRAGVGAEVAGRLRELSDDGEQEHA